MDAEETPMISFTKMKQGSTSVKHKGEAEILLATGL